MPTIFTPHVLLVIDILGAIFAIANIFLFYKSIWTRVIFVLIAIYLALGAYGNLLKVLAS